LNATIRSVLEQTYSNLELIIINDGSKDESLEIINQFTDQRLKVFSQTNSGLAKALNLGILHSSGALIARQDQDDISRSTRIEKQVKRFATNPDLVLLGTQGWVISETGDMISKIRLPLTNHDLKYTLNFYNPFVHTSIMIRAKVLKEIGGYSENSKVQPPEDFELWGRIKDFGHIGNLRDRLVEYRLSASSMSRLQEETIARNYKNIVVQNLQKTFKFSYKDATAFFSLQFLRGSKYSLLVKVNLVRKFIHRFFQMQLASNFFGLYVYIDFLKMIIRILIK
jgi:glycosyltransferase involved in cell wall biosynthesis